MIPWEITHLESLPCCVAGVSFYLTVFLVCVIFVSVWQTFSAAIIHNVIVRFFLSDSWILFWNIVFVLKLFRVFFFCFGLFDDFVVCYSLRILQVLFVLSETLLPQPLRILKIRDDRMSLELTPPTFEDQEI